MERRQLEDRIRASLQARADDVQPTPELWERVSSRTARRARWQLGVWALSGVAAVVAVVVGGIVLLGSPRSVQIEPEPDIVDTPDQTEDTTPRPGVSATATVVTTDGTTLFRVDPATGEVVADLAPRAGLQEGAAIREVAVRPASDEGVLTVATVIEIEGGYDVEVYVFDADGNRIDRLNIGMAAPTAGDLPPDVVWSADGRYLMWAGSSGPSGPALWAYDWVERPVDGNGIAQPFTAAPPGTPSELFQRGDVVDLREWSGPSDGQSTVVATSTTGGAYRIDLTHEPSDCAGATPCPPTFVPSIQDLAFEGGSAMDLGTLGNGVNLALMVRSSQDRDAEGAALELVADPMSDQGRRLEIPQLTAGTAAPPDAWMATAGNRVAIGFGPQAAYLVTVGGDVVEELEVTGTVPLPEGTLGAALAVVGGSAPGPDPESTAATPTEGPTAAPALAADGVPTRVVTNGPGRGQLHLVDRSAPSPPVASWQRPAALGQELFPGDVAVHPASTPTDVQLVTRWTAGGSDVFVRTVVRDGEVVVNEPLATDQQPDNTGGAGEIAQATPVFSPSGEWLAWVETPQGADGSAQVRLVPWGADGPTGSGTAVVAPDGVTRPSALADWASTSKGDVLTMTPDTEPGSAAQAPAAMVELRLDVTSGLVAQADADDWRTVELPGILFEAGSVQVDGGAERYIAFDGGDQVRYGLADAPGSAVPTGAYAFSEGEVVAFGPGSALVHRADGAWQRVQVDDGATSAVEVPDGTVAVLPWPAG